MKKIKIICLLLLIAIFGNSCKKGKTTDDEATDPINGTWKVSSYIENSVDLTSQFSNYTLICNASGNLTIQGNGNSYNCSWNWNDANHSMCSFHIMGCDQNSVLWDLDEDWDYSQPDPGHLNFTSHNPKHHNSIIWIKI